MAVDHLARLLFSFAIITSSAGADHAVAAKNDTQVHVVIGPVENITSYFIGSDSIVVTWDDPPVYLIHDVVNASLEQIRPGTIVVVSKHKNNGTVDQGLGTNATMNLSDSNSWAASKNETDSPVSETNTTTSTTWKCQPISFFDNYTVDVKEDINDTENSVMVAFKDSIHEAELHKVNITGSQKYVPFSQGCITDYEISWQEVNQNSKDDGFSGASSTSVPSTFSTANITGLKPATSYRVLVTAVYVSRDRLTNTPPVQFTTKRTGENKTCTCDMYGTISPMLGCSMNGSVFCVCKPGYEGQFCEMCAPGYYRTAPHHPCHRCPCESHATRVRTCRFVEGFLRCDACDVGYTGNLCHECDKGFYRFNHHCVKCFCNGNTSPDPRSMTCLPNTGMCIHCQHNTTGFHCERCQQDYVGDPITYKNCTWKGDVIVKSFNMGSSVTTGVVAAIVITFLLIILLVAGVMLLRRYYYKERRRAFWTIEMKKESDDVDFNSVHNDDARLGSAGGNDFFSNHRDAGDGGFFSNRGMSSSTGKYSKLQEEI